MKANLIIFLAFFFLISCEKPSEDSGAITILQVNDVYELSPVEGGKYGGLARLQTVFKRLKKQNPNTISILAGDLLSPSALSIAKYEGSKLAGRQMVAVLNAMKWDYFVLGNHEFDLKEKDLRKRMEEMEMTTISDNVLDMNGQPFPNTQKHQVVEIAGIKVGLMGLTMNTFDTDYAKISDPIAAATEIVKDLKDQNADIIIAFTHQDMDEDEQIVIDNPDIDLVIGGHEHENYHQFRGNFTPIAKADANAKSAYIHQLYYDQKTKKLKIKSELLIIDESIPDDPEIAKLVDEWTEIAFKSFEEEGLMPKNVICETTVPLDGREASVRNFPTNLTKLITDAFLSAYGNADAAIMNGGSIRIDDQLQPGPVREYDIMRISPFGGDISLVEMSGATLLKAIDQGQKNKGIGAYLQYSRISQANGNWQVNGVDIDPARTYKIAISSYLVERGDTNLGFLTFDQNEVKKSGEANQKFFKVVIDQFKKEFPGP